VPVLTLVTSSFRHPQPDSVQFDIIAACDEAKFRHSTTLADGSTQPNVGGPHEGPQLESAVDGGRRMVVDRRSTLWAAWILIALAAASFASPRFTSGGCRLYAPCHSTGDATVETVPAPAPATHHDYTGAYPPVASTTSSDEVPPAAASRKAVLANLRRALKSQLLADVQRRGGSLVVSNRGMVSTIGSIVWRWSPSVPGLKDVAAAVTLVLGRLVLVAALFVGACVLKGPHPPKPDRRKSRSTVAVDAAARGNRVGPALSSPADEDSGAETDTSPMPSPVPYRRDGLKEGPGVRSNSLLRRLRSIKARGRPKSRRRDVMPESISPLLEPDTAPASAGLASSQH